MASVLRQIVASNRVKHQDTGLDLCYVTSNLLATLVIPLFFFIFSVSFSYFRRGRLCIVTSFPSLRRFLLARLPRPVVDLIRKAVARPRVRHTETGLDLGFIAGGIIVTSGPSQTYPRLAYRYPLDRLVSFLDAKHGDNWAIWEFRAEGTGYPDEAVYNRIRHYPWPDHHPPPFALVPLIVASMKNWLDGGELDGGGELGRDGKDGGTGLVSGGAGEKGSIEVQVQKGEGQKEQGEVGKKGDRVAVVHCKAGKGRSGTMVVSYLISQCGWTAEDALARFTERRMRKGYGSGVSIPSQLRWVSYADRWSKHGKKYVDMPIEIVEIHVWGLRHGVKLEVEGYENEGKKIKVFHTFRHDERIVVEGDAPGGRGVVDLFTDMAGYVMSGADGEIVESADYEEVTEGRRRKERDEDGHDSPSKTSSRASSLLRKVSKRIPRAGGPVNTLADGRGKAKTIAMPAVSQAPSSSPIETSPPDQSQSATSLRSASISFADEAEPGGRAVIFKPKEPIRVPNSDVNIVIERRNRVRASKMLTMVTSVAHVWFNAFFEGNGPEQDGQADDNGVFEIEWDMLDGIKGSRQRGTRACDRLSVVWRVVGTGTKEELVDKPSGHASVPQMEPADWKGANHEDPTGEVQLGLRVADPESASISQASSVKSLGGDDGGYNAKDKEAKKEDVDNGGFLGEGVKVSGPDGEDVLDDAAADSSAEKRGAKK